MKDSHIDLKEWWTKLAVKYTADRQFIEYLFYDLITHYSEVHRHYHNPEHIRALVRLFDQNEHLLTKSDVVLFSIFYHDIVYTPGRGDNEYQSAQTALNYLQQLGAPDQTRKEVAFYINTTKDHKVADFDSYDLKLFIDFDLSILASQRAIYKAYLLNIRKEYNYLPLEQFALGRQAFLQSMLQKPHIFYTNEFRAKEEIARKNMLWELETGPGIFSAG